MKSSELPPCCVVLCCIVLCSQQSQGGFVIVDFAWI